MNEENTKEATIDLENRGDCLVDAVPNSPFRLDPVDLLILFPTFPALPRSLSGPPNSVDGAAELRKLQPLDAEALLDALRPLPALRVLTDVQLRLT
jgi:hypothetical protein